MKNMNVIMCSCALLISAYCFEADGSNSEENVNTALAVGKQHKTAQWQASWAKGFAYENEKAAEEHWIEIAKAPENRDLKWNEWCGRFVRIFDQKYVEAGGVISGEVPLSLIQAKTALMYDKYVKDPVKSRFNGHETDVILDMLEGYTKDSDVQKLKRKANDFIECSKVKGKFILHERECLRERLERTKDCEKNIINMLFEILREEENRVFDYERIVSPLGMNALKQSDVIRRAQESLWKLTDAIYRQYEDIMEKIERGDQISVLAELQPKLEMQQERIERIKALSIKFEELLHACIRIEIESLTKQGCAFKSLVMDALQQLCVTNPEMQLETLLKTERSEKNSMALGQEQKNTGLDSNFASLAVPISPRSLGSHESRSSALTTIPRPQPSYYVRESFGSLGEPHMSVNDKPFISSRNLSFNSLNFNSLLNSSSSSSSSGSETQSETQEEFHFNDDDETATVVHEGESPDAFSRDAELKKELANVGSRANLLESDFGIGADYDEDRMLQEAIEMSMRIN